MPVAVPSAMVSRLTANPSPSVPTSRLMISIRCAIVFVSASLITPGLNAQELKQFTVDALVAKNIEAKGGIDALHAVQSLRLKGKMLVNQGQLEVYHITEREASGKIRTEATLQG